MPVGPSLENKQSNRQFLLRLFCCTFISIGLLQASYCHWPKALCFDATFSVFAAQNAVNHGHFETIEPNRLTSPDLGTIHLQWLNSWPPVVSVVFAALLKCGLTAGGATTGFTIVLLLGGTWFWVLCFKEAEAPSAALYCLAALIPWTAFPLSSMTIFYNDLVPWALAPMAYFLLLRLPVTVTPLARDFWVRWPLTGLVCGLLVVAKYSALPLVLGSGVYFLFRDGWGLTARKISHAIWFGVFLFLPGGVVYLLNRLWTGQATAQVHGSQPLFLVGLPQLWNLVVSPLTDLSGLSVIAFHLPARFWITAGLSLPALVIWFGLGCAWFKHPRSEAPNQFVRLLILMSITTWVFLLCLTLILGYQCDWTGQPRYSFPVAFAWFGGGMVLIFNQRVPKVLRACLTLAYCLPVGFTLLAGAARPFLHAVPAQLPQSQLAGTPNEREACRFLEAKLANDPQRRPQLIIANNPHPMNELLIPVVPWMYLEPQNQVKSSRPLTVWALLDSTASAELRHRLDEDSRVERVDVSAGFPWEFLIITFP